MATSTCDGSATPVVQAEPEETANPRASNLSSRVELSQPGRQRQSVLGSRAASTATTRTSGISDKIRRCISSRSDSIAPISTEREQATAAVIPAAPGTFTVPPRRERSWLPPCIQRVHAAPWRTNIAPIPLGAPNLCPEIDTNPTGSSDKSTAIRPKHCTASRCNGILRPRSSGAKVPTSEIAPVSLLAQIRLTRAVTAGSAAARTSSGSQVPSGRKPTRTTSHPWRSRTSHTPRVQECSPWLVTIRFFPRCAATQPWIAAWMLSVPPEVRIHSIARDFVQSAKAWRARSAVSEARRPSSWREDAFPHESRIACPAASMASGQTGAVAFQSR